MAFEPIDAAMLLFATIGPLKVTIVCAALTANATPEHLRAVAKRSVLISLAVCIAFVLFGEMILRLFKVSVPAFQVAGGIIVLIFSIEMVGGKKAAPPVETSPDSPPEDIALYPLAIPLMASVSGLVAIVSLLAQGDDLKSVSFLAAMIVGIMAMDYVCLRSCQRIVRFIGTDAIRVAEKIMGVLLAALAVELFVMGVVGFGFLPKPTP